MSHAWRRARTVLLRVPPDLLMLQPVGELLIAGARLGDRGTVETCLAAVRRLLARAGDPPVWTLWTRWDELQVAIALDDLSAARAAAKAAAALPWFAPRAAALAEAAVCWVDSLTGAPDPGRVRAAARALADAGLTWEAARLAGGAAIRMADSGQMRSLLQFARELSAPAVPVLADAAGELSPREQDVAAHLLAGLTYREIGAQLFIAPKTVEHHVARIRRRLGVQSRSELLLALRRYVPSAAG
jgi:DNA-binding CsgD family transcriptional regulator